MGLGPTHCTPDAGSPRRGARVGVVPSTKQLRPSPFLHSNLRQAPAGCPTLYLHKLRGKNHLPPHLTSGESEAVSKGNGDQGHRATKWHC